MSAAAAVLFGVDPSLTSSQVTRILERHADDVNAANGCDQCPDGRDKYSGWGRLDVTKAVNFLSSGNPLPPSDRFEPNDSVSQARKLWGSRPSLDATLDFWDDPVDVYRVRLLRGQRLHARLAARWANASVALTLLRPGPKSMHGQPSLRLGRRIPAGRSGSRTARRAAAGTTSSCGSRATAAAATRWS